VGGYILWDELSIFISHRVPEAIFFRGDSVMTTIMEMANRHGKEKYLAGFEIMKSGKLGEIEPWIYSKGWIIIFPGGIKTGRP